MLSKYVKDFKCYSVTFCSCKDLNSKHNVKILLNASAHVHGALPAATHTRMHQLTPVGLGKVAFSPMDNGVSKL